MQRTLFLVAGLVVLVVPIAIAVAVRGGGSAASAPSSVPTTPSSAEPKPPALPPRGAVVLAREDGNDALALAVTPTETRVTLMDAQGDGVNGKSVSIAGAPASPCGSGCYGAAVSRRGPVAIDVAGRHFTLVIPPHAQDATALMRRATDAFRGARSVTYVERLASSTAAHIVSTFTLEAPNRVEYRIAHGAAGIVIGTKRWDRSDGRWSESASTLLPQPSPVWGDEITNAHVLARSRSTIEVSFVNPSVPAWFDVRLDVRTLLPRKLDMIAAAHFMHHRYVAFNAPRKIFPPR